VFRGAFRGIGEGVESVEMVGGVERERAEGEEAV
jgi:hypothetical protein